MLTWGKIPWRTMHPAAFMVIAFVFRASFKVKGAGIGLAASIISEASPIPKTFYSGSSIDLNYDT